MRAASPDLRARSSFCLGLGQPRAQLGEERVGLDASRPASSASTASRTRCSAARIRSSMRRIASRGTCPIVVELRLQLAQRRLRRLGVARRRAPRRAAMISSFLLLVLDLLGVARRRRSPSGARRTRPARPGSAPTARPRRRGRRAAPPSTRSSGRASPPPSRASRWTSTAPRRGRPAAPWPPWRVPRSASSWAKCWPRRRPNASRAAANRFHSASSVLAGRCPDLPPLVDDRAQPVAGRLPRRSGLGDLLGLDDQRLLGRDRVGAGLLAGGRALAGLLLAGGRAGRRGGCRGAARSPIAAAPDTCSLRCSALRAGRAGIARAGLEPLLEQLHLGREVVEAPPVERQAGLGVAGLPRPDLALAVGGPDVDGAVGVDPSPRLQVSDRGVGRGSMTKH